MSNNIPITINGNKLVGNVSLNLAQEAQQALESGAFCLVPSILKKNTNDETGKIIEFSIVPNVNITIVSAHKTEKGANKRCQEKVLAHAMVLNEVDVCGFGMFSGLEVAKEVLKTLNKKGLILFRFELAL